MLVILFFVECEHGFSHEHKFSLSHILLTLSHSLSLQFSTHQEDFLILLNVIDGVRLAASSFVFNDDGGKIRYLKHEKGSRI